NFGLLLAPYFHRHSARELDHKAIRDYKRRALNFHLDVRRPEAIRLQAGGAPGRRPSLNEIVREKLLTRPLDSDVDRDALIERAIGYLDESQLIAAVPSGLLDTCMRLHSMHLGSSRQH